MENAYLIKLENIDVSIQGRRILHGITWQLKKGENWAVLGPNGAGKTTFLRLIRGEIWPDQHSKGKRIYNLDGITEESPIDINRKISIVSPENHDAYIRNIWEMTAEEFIQTGFFNSVWLQQKPDHKQMDYATLLIDTLGLNDLMHKSILALSGGEARKILIARALVSQPKILMLDEFLSGLDNASRRGVIDLTEKIVHSRTQIIHTAHRVKDVLPSTTHILRLSSGVIISQGEKVVIPNLKGFLPAIQMPSRRNSRQARSLSGKDSGYFVEIRNADIYIDDRKILNKINWKIRSKENWGILGENGAGKSTLLRLIMGDPRPAAGGKILRFGKGEEEGIRDMKKRIGYVSSSLQAEYDHHLTGREVVLSGFFSSIGLYEDITGVQKKTAERWIRFFKAETICEKTVLSMSYGEFRKILLLRATVSEPEILLLDEPFSGLDQQTRKDFMQTIDQVAGTGATVLMATHHPDEFVPSIAHILILENGRIKTKGMKQKTLSPDYS
jgi:molybdate transport system ATP-binding protein